MGKGKALSHAEADAAQVEGRLTGYQCDQSDEGSAEHHGDGQQSSVAQGPEQPPEARLLTVMDRAATTIKKLGLA